MLVKNYPCIGCGEGFDFDPEPGEAECPHCGDVWYVDVVYELLSAEEIADRRARGQTP